MGILHFISHEKNYRCQKEDVYLRQDAAFFEAIDTGDQSVVRSSLEEALHTQQVVNAIHRSLSIGRPVPLLLGLNSEPTAAAGNRDR